MINVFSSSWYPFLHEFTGYYGGYLNNYIICAGISDTIKAFHSGHVHAHRHVEHAYFRSKGL